VFHNLTAPRVKSWQKARILNYYSPGRMFPQPTAAAGRFSVRHSIKAVLDNYMIMQEFLFI